MLVCTPARAQHLERGARELGSSGKVGAARHNLTLCQYKKADTLSTYRREEASRRRRMRRVRDFRVVRVRRDALVYAADVVGLA